MSKITNPRSPRKMAREASPAADAEAAADAVETSDNERRSPEASPAAVPAPAPKPPAKIAQVLELLRREEGATLAQLVAATGWQPHTTRAALTGLRKKGHVIVKHKDDDGTRYTVVAEAAAQ